MLFLAAGIILYQFIHLPVGILIGLITFAFILFISQFFLSKTDWIYKFRWIFGFATFLLLLVAGYFSCMIFDDQNAFTELNKKSVFKVELRSAPIEKARSYMCKVKLIRRYEADKVERCNGTAIIYLQKDSIVSSLLLGDLLLIDAEFKIPDGVQNPNGFDYARYLKRQGIGATAYIPTGKWQKSGQSTGFDIRRIADRSRSYLLNIYRKFEIRDDEFAVLGALTLGYTDALQPDLLKSYSASGATHILSVSGLHVAIVYAVIFSLLGFLSNTKRQKVIRSIITTLFIWIYAFLTGLSPAVLRASLMMSFVAAGTCLEKKSQIVNTVLISAFIMLLYNPNLIFDIGFQLSYSAVLGIVFFQPKLSKLLYVKNNILKFLWDLTTVSIAAQIGTAPFVLYYFHQFSNYFLLTNFVAIPLSTGIIYLAMALLFLSKVPFLSIGIAFVLKWTLWLMNFLIEKIQELPGSISIISLNWIQLILCFIVIFSFTLFYFNKKYSVLITGMVSIFVILGIYSYQKLNSLRSSRMIVFSDSRIPVINFIDGASNYIFTTDTFQAEKVASSFWKSNLLEKPQYLKGTDWFSENFAYFKNNRILILENNFLKHKTTSTPLEVDYLIISNKIKPEMEQILTCVRPKNVIVDKSISQWYTNHIREVCKFQNINFYSVAEKGAFVVNFTR
ncbi:MAG: ComEC/Rec2 family competence protein [Paludibacteraceae bacterium]